VLGEIARTEALGVVFLGSRSGAEELSTAADSLGRKAAVYAAPASDFMLVSGLVASAVAFLGCDSGLSHLAQALHVPGVIVFGGGYWPAYTPWGNGAVGIACRLPCFGCDWDCPFDAVCIDRIPEAAVLAELRRVLKEAPAGPEIVELDNVDDA